MLAGHFAACLVVGTYSRTWATVSKPPRKGLRAGPGPSQDLVFNFLSMICFLLFEVTAFRKEREGETREEHTGTWAEMVSWVVDAFHPLPNSSYRRILSGEHCGVYSSLQKTGTLSTRVGQPGRQYNISLDPPLFVKDPWHFRSSQNPTPFPVFLSSMHCSS